MHLMFAAAKLMFAARCPTMFVPSIAAIYTRHMRETNCWYLTADVAR